MGLLDVTCCSHRQTSIPGLLLPLLFLCLCLWSIILWSPISHQYVHQRGAHCQLITGLLLPMTESVVGWVWLKVSWGVLRFLAALSTGTNSLETRHSKQSFLLHAPVTAALLKTLSFNISLWWGFTKVGDWASICDKIESTCDIWRGQSWITHEFIFRTGHQDNG